MATSVVNFTDLGEETAELLPRRETLLLDININASPVIGVNLAAALNAATIGSVANAGAWQELVSLNF